MAIKVDIDKVLFDSQRRCVYLQGTIPADERADAVYNEELEYEDKVICFRFNTDTKQELDDLEALGDRVRGWEIDKGNCGKDENKHIAKKIKMIPGHSIFINERYIWTQYTGEKKPKKK